MHLDESEEPGRVAVALRADRTALRRWEAAAIDRRLRSVMLVATVLVIPDLILEEQPLRASWHTVAAVGDWTIWGVFLIEFFAVMCFARDWEAWLRRYPLALPLLILTPPFAPAAIQGMRAFRLLRLVRVGRSFELLSKLFTFDGVKYAVAVAVFLILGSGTVFASVESHVGNHVSVWDGIWWAIGTASTEGSNVPITTNAGRAIAILLMFTGIGVFSMITGAVATRFVQSTPPASTIPEITRSEESILAKLDELAARLALIHRAGWVVSSGRDV